MKNSLLFRAGIFLFVITLFSLPVKAQHNPSSQGVEFFLTFMKNGYRGCNGMGLNENLTVIVSAQRGCNVTVRNPRTGWSTTRPVGANALLNITIPEMQAYMTTSEVVENKGLIVTATDTISLFIANEATNSFDASFILPTPSLMEQYIVQSFTPTTYPALNCSGVTRSAFAIIATEDNTTVVITPRKATSGGHQANVPFLVTLNRGQSYQVLSASSGDNGDLSGSLIVARECKRIAVFNGNVLTSVPNLDGGMDHIFEQAMPTAYWGKEFVVTSSSYRTGGDYVKITALENNTQVRRNGTLLATLNAQNSHTFLQLSSPGSCFIETTKPAAVNLYQTTSSFDQSQLGDPSMVWISPIEQQLKSITFGTFTAQNQTITVHRVNIVTRTADVGSMTLDGVDISSEFSPVQGNANYSFARVAISAGTHTLRNDVGFTAYVYGFGRVIGYAYSVGSSTFNLAGEIHVNNIPLSQLDSNFFI